MMTTLDKQMALESLIAGIIELSKELDEIENKSKTMVSDERCKQAENFIENNPEEAAANLSGPLQKEAEQVLDGDERTSEVNDEVLEKHIGDFLNYGKKERRKKGEAKQAKQNALDELDMISTEDMRSISEMGGTDNPYSPAVTNGESYGDDYKALAPTSGLDLDLTGIEDLPAVTEGPVEDYNFDWAYEVLPDEQKEEFEQVPDEQKEEWLKLHDITPPEGFYGSGVSGGGAASTSSLDLDLTSEVPTTETTPSTTNAASSGSTTAATVSGDTNSEISNTTGNVTAKGTPNIIGSAEDNYGSKNVPGNNTSGNTTSNGATSSSATEKTGTLKAPKPSKLPDGESNNQVENNIDLSEASIENIRNRVAQLNEDVAIQNGFENDSFNGVPLSQLEGNGINEAMKVLDTLGV